MLGVICFRCTSARSIVDFDPTTAQITARFRRHVNHVGMLLLSVSRKLAGELEIHQCGFAVENMLVSERSLDLSVHKEDHFIIGDRKPTDAILAIRVTAHNLLESASVFGSDMHFGAPNGVLG